jgi:hypothetical protein
VDLSDVPNYVLILVGQVFTAGATYGALRSDLKAMHERLSAHEKGIDRAHVRLDDHLEGH